MFAWQLPLASGDEGWIKLIFFIVIIVGSLIVQGIKKLRGEADEEEQPTQPRRSLPTRPVAPPPTRPYNAQSEEVRKFLEALGKPRTTPPPPPVLRPIAQRSPPQPPPPVRRRPVAPPPRPVLVSSQGFSEEEEQEGPHNIITGESTRQPIRPLEQIDLSKEMEAVMVQPYKMSPVASTIPTLAISRASQLAKMLADKTNVRQAVVLAEVIGPPKAFQ